MTKADLDECERGAFLQQLYGLREKLDKWTNTLFFLALEEIEAWYMGDLEALFKAYPSAQERHGTIASYAQDAICNTWEPVVKIALNKDIADLCLRGRCESGEFKRELARKIMPHMDVEGNRSPSFRAFRDGLRKAAGMSGAP